MVTAKDTCLILCSYALGCCTFGYYWALWNTGTDIRMMGSGSVGATNVGRKLGPSAFAVTFLFDFAKGSAVVAAARLLQASPAVITACMVGVVAGHIWPVQLRFLGGKGIATSLGALSIYNWAIALILLCLFVPILLISRRFVFSGMVVVVFAPLCVLLIGLRHADVEAVSLLAILVLIAHRRNIREEISRLRFGGGAVNVKHAAERSKDL